MKSGLYFLFFVLFVISFRTWAANPIWVRQDKVMIRSVVKLDKSNPVAVEAYFTENSREKKENLGFGWKMLKTGVSGGYVSIGATLLYFNDQLVSYRIAPEMPGEFLLRARYRKWYSQGFELSSGAVLPYVYNEDRLRQPLSGYPGKLHQESVPPEVGEYATPYSGTMFGYMGGYAGGLLENRLAFKTIKDRLTTEHVVFLMYSINLASRLTAIEYYLTHRTDFSDTLKLDNWVARNFSETPTVYTLTGCLGGYQPVQMVSGMYADIEYPGLTYHYLSAPPDAFQALLEFRLYMLEADRPGEKVHGHLSWNSECSESEVTYLGLITTRSGKQYKLVNSFFVTGESCRGISRLVVYDSLNNYIGNYKVDLLEYLPDELKENKLVYRKGLSKDCERRSLTEISFENGIPENIFIECAGTIPFEAAEE